MTDNNAAPAAAEGADALGILLDAMMERHTASDGRPYLKCRDCACPSPMVVPHEQKHRAWCAVKRALLAARPAPTAAPREGGVVGAVLGELEWRHWSTRDGSERMCLLCERDESRGHATECRMAAAREADDEYQAHFGACHDQLNTAIARVALLEGLLRAMASPVCAFCGRIEADGHAPDCRYVTALTGEETRPCEG